MEKVETSFNDMQTVKRNFFAMRNGVIADTLRRGGSPFRIIFGLNLPQISEIAAKWAPDTALAERLWANQTTRESMLLAPMIVDRQKFTIDDARCWVAVIPAHEVADVMCLKLLRHTDYAAKLAAELAGAEAALSRYTAVRLMFNLVQQDPRAALEFADRMLESETDSVCRTVARQLREECEFLLEEES
ncbi:MAG: DNA alkylation repair protein [Muribaculaceae bacterium]|nr:DNA alkylation repair protein [Muribaculaceae bacterium]